MSLTVLLMLFLTNLIPIKSICLQSELYSPTEMICPGKNSVISKLSSNDFESIDRDIATSFSLANSNIYILNGSSDGTTVSTCTGTFVDSGNTSSNYSNNEDYEITFCSDDGDVMTFEFISWDVENNGACNKDVLTIYDGPGTYSLLIGEFCTNSPGLISSTGNCITFRFESNSSNTESGWEALITCGIPEINNCPNSNCTDAELNWYSNNAGGYTWTVGDAINTYSIPYSGGSVGVTVELLDPFNRSVDYDLHSAATHPFDPAGGCDSKAGNCNSGRDDVPNNGSISDPWDSDCGLLYTETLGGYGPGYLTFGIKTETSDETITFRYTFDEPVLLCDFRVADIDYNGLQHTYDTSCEEENPGSSYQDAVTFSASGPLGNVPVVLTTNYSGALILDPPNQTVFANYDTNQNGNISPSNPDGEVVVSTAQAVTELNIAYYNGPADKADELNNPHLYSWWSDTNGATSGVSDDHGIRLDGVQFCICPTFSIAPLSQEMCLGETATATFGISGGVGPYEIYLDGVLQTDLTFTDSPTETTSYQLVVYDSAGCLAEEQFTFVVNPDPAVNTYAGTILCYGDDLNLYENGGDAVSWNWEGPLSFSSNDQNPTIANAILSNGGDYYVTVTDINGCTNTDFINVSIPAPVTCVMSVISDVSCYGGNDGQVSVSGSGGTPPYTYDWGGADPDALEASSYTVTVSDVNDCTNTCSVVVNEPPALNCTTSVISDVSCYGASDGQASVSGSGGTAPYTYNWGSADPSALSVGTYIVTVTDNNNCTSTCSVSINEPPVLNCTASVISDVSCYGGNDGQASISATGGVAPYSFDWGGADPLALSAGTYTVTVTDANLCTSTCSVQIDEPPLLTCLASVVSDVGCFGGNDGQASVSASGGVSPYSFNWGGEDPLALSAGTYTITVTDANNCTSTCSVTINEPPVLTCLASVVSDVGCFGGNDGQASVSAAGGVGPYSFNWGGEDPLALSVGTYTVTVTDANLCTSTCSVTINEPPLLSCSTSVVSDVGCFGGNDGQASVSASGGVAPYSFNWGGEDPLSLSAGTYTVTVTDANNCTSTCSVTINEPPLLTCSTTIVSDVSCFGGNDGQASVSASGGVAPYSFNWGGEDPLSLSAGTYTVTVTDANYCTSTCSVTINEPPLLTCSTTKIKDVDCFGGDDGQASVSASGGVAPYSFNWGGEDPLSLSAGTYAVTVTDANSCTSTCSVTIDEPQLLNCMASVISDVSCFGGDDGQASVSASGGVSPYSFNWGGEDPLSLSAGTYTVTVADANSCTSTCSVTINEPPILTCSITKIKDVDCFGGNDGQASVSASGGVEPYSFNWGGEDPLSLIAGSYTMTVTDANNCTSTCSVTIDEPPLLTCSTTVVSDVSCFGGTDGKAGVSASGGVSPYSFDWGGEDPLALSVGTYIVTVTDANNCTSTCSVTINEPQLLTCSITKIKDVDCFGGNDGQASVSASGGVVPYSFNWGGEDPLALSAGTYTVTVTDANNCTSTCSVTINEPPLLNCTTSVVSDVGCFGGDDGQTSVSASGGVSPYSFDWGGEDPLALSAGTYTVSVTDANYCTSTCSVTINEPPLLTCSTTKIKDVDCFGGDDGQASVSASGGVAPYSFNWGGEDPLSLSAGTYAVTVTDANSCISTCSVTIDEPQLLNCMASVISDVSCFGGDDGQASVSASGGVSPYSFNWGGEDPLSLSAGTYTVTVADANSCTSTCSVTITEPPLLTCSTTVVSDVSCFGGNDGQASASAVGGVSPYSFDWGGEDPLALSAGTYAVTVTDVNNCTSTCSVTINEPPILTCSITKIKDVDCFGGNDGQASVSASGGVEPYSFNWGGEDPLSLIAGSYTMTVTDANNCTSTCSVTIDEPPLLTCSITKIKDVDCYAGNDGQASVSAAGGVAPYSFNWGGEDPLSLSVGTYTVTVADANNCTSTCSVTINEPNAGLECEISITNFISCNGCNDGSAIVNISGGISPYTEDWGSANPNALSAGMYIVTVTDANDCETECVVLFSEPDQLQCEISVEAFIPCYGGYSEVQPVVSGGIEPYYFDWGGEDPNELYAGTYTLTVTDSGSAECTHTFTIDEPPLLTCSTTVVSDVSCYGGTDGRASVSASGGVTPYSYDWGSANPLALNAGIYTVTVKDENMCTSTCSVTIGEPPLLTCSTTVISDVSCFGGDGGQASVSASGGVSPYSFDWGGEDPLALSQGTYTVTVTDANYCTSTCSVSIDEPQILTCSITKIKDVDCYGGHDGQASVSATGGVSPYSFNWGGEDPLALSAGTYTVTVTDANYCTSTCSVTIDEPPLLTCLASVVSDVGCFGGDDGQASVSATGGVNPYSFDWGSEDSMALSVGTYIVVVTDANYCTSTCSVTIDEPPLLTCSITKIKDVDCYGGNDGQASVSATGGVAPYSFNWGGVDPLSLSAGNYTVTVTDANNCTSTCSVTIDEPPLLTCSTTVVSDVSCFGGHDGQASVSASGGVSPYSFDWGGEDPLALSVGAYIVTVTDANYCTSTCSVTIDEPPLLTCSITKIKDVDCYGGNDGQASVSASGGVSPYSFDWGGEDPLDLSVGTYIVTVTDANYCASTCSVTVDEPPILTCSITKIKDADCFGGSDGQASVSASGGVAPYSFNWGGEDPLALNVGTYIVTVTDANYCTSTCSVTIDEPPLLTCSTTLVSDVSCFGGNDGQASVSASGGVSPYSFDWGGEDPLALSVGTYIVTVTDANYCTSTCSVTIDEPPLLTCSTTVVSDVSCFGGNDGQASVSASGGVSPYSFDWGGEDPLSLSAGTYTVTVTDANSCTSTCSVTINEPPLLTCSTTVVSDVGCFGGNDGQASVSAIGGVVPYSFDWGGADPLALSVGTYIVTVTDVNYCTSTCSVTINEPPLLTCSTTVVSDVSCFGGNDGQASVSASGGVSPYSFDWGGEDPLALSVGTYIVTVTDANYCTSTCSVTIDEPPLLTCSTTVVSDVSCFAGNDGQASVSASGGVSPYSFDWGGEDPLSLSVGTYIVTVTDANYCTSTCSVTIDEPPLLTCSITKIKDVDCYGSNDGQASVSAAGGVSPFSFDWGGEDPLTLSVGTYIVTVTDANNCTSTCSVTIDEPPLLTCSITKIKDVDCYGGNDGQASVSAVGGVSPYSFDWGGEDPLALSVGAYIVTVTDANYCTSTCSVTIDEPPLLTCSITKIKDVDCYGGNDGQASVSASGGVSPYSFDWGGEDPLDLSVGTYIVTVTDANYCASTCSVTVDEPPILTCSITKIKDADCFGGSDGQASVSASGGVSPYSFDWGGEDPLALSVGTYIVTVTDANYCTSTCSVTIDEPPLLTCLASVVSDVGCFGGNDGQASVSAIGGVNPYSFDWGGEDLLSLSVGTYAVTVTDANNCTSTCSIIINEPPLLTCLASVVSDVGCFGGNDGQASVSASGGVSPYSFDWGGEDPLSLSVGTYTVTVTDANNCTSTCSVTIVEPPLLTCLASVVSDVGCFGGNDGQASVSASGGVSPYSFDWGGEDPLALSVGAYIVTVTDANYCTSTCSVTIDEPPLLTCSITKIKDVDCYGGNDGQASVSASGGVSPYSFDWGGEDPLALSVGTYIVTVTDANYCTNTCSVTIDEPPILTCSITKIKDVDCYGGSDGQASVSATGGVSPYSFDWGGEDPLALSAGVYTVTVTDSNYCTSTCSVTIAEPPILTCSISKIKDADCFGGSDGQANVSAFGGVAPYSFDWGGFDPNSLGAGTYTVTVTDTNYCTSTCSVTIDEPPLLTCSITKIKDVDCYGGNDGQASVSATGGVSPYSFDWGGEDPLSLSVGTYTVTVTDANLCTSTCSLTIDEPTLLTCSITKIKDVDCYGGNDGQASVSAFGGVSPYSFDWGGEDPLSLSVGTYIVTVTDANYCTSTCSVTIDEPPLLTCSITKIKDVDCYGGTDGQADVSASGGVSPYSFDWGGEDPLALSVSTYIVTVTDANYCTSTCSVTINEPPLLTCSTTVVSDVSCFGGTDGQAGVSASGGVSPYSFDWGGEDPLSLSVGTYIVTVSDANYCTSTCSVTIDEPPILTCSITKIKDVDCYGGSDGQASVSATGGVSPYSFDWGGEDPLALSAGVYTVTVTDSNYCTSTCSVTIAEPPILTCSISKIKDADCFGGSDGQANVSAFGGVAPYSFDWGGFDPNSLGAGTYTVTVTDTNYCTSTCSVEILDASLLTCDITKIKDVDCYGGSDGQASVSASGGTAPYSFDWGGEDPMALSAGSYVVTVTDANYCSSVCNVQIYEPPLLTCSTTVVSDVSCFGGTDGQASVSANGGASPYSFDWGGEDPMALAAGSYVVTVTDANYCTSTCYVDIYEPPLLACTITKIKDVDCYGGTDGQASVSASGGVSPYSFDWGGADPLALSAGVYTVTVTDGNNCTTTCNVTIDEPPLLTCALVKLKDVDCFDGNDGQASVSASGGVSPYSFDWGGEDPLALSAGVYTVTVTDSNYCTSTCSVTIAEPPILTCSISKIKDADCFGGSDGQANVSAFGGVAPYSFDWGGFDPNSLGAGTYTVTVTDTNYCTSTCSVEILDASLLTCDITKIKDVDCYGGSDGQASVSASGGTAPYSFDWGGEDPMALSAGSYVVTVTDANYCSSVCNVQIYEPPLLTCSTTVVSDVSCFGGTDGQASVSANGGASPYSFDWGGEDPMALAAGSYVVTVTDANYCTSTCYVDIYEPPLLACTITKIKDVDCYGGTDGQASVSASGGVSPYSFDWGGADPLALSAGVYTVTVTDGNNCTTTCNVTIDEPPLLTCALVKLKDVDCFDGNDGQASVSASGGVSPYSFDWGGEDPLALSAGSYVVTVTDANYCTSTCSVEIEEFPMLGCLITKISDVNCYGGFDGQVSVSANGGAGSYTFNWGGEDPMALSAGLYTVTVTDNNSCTSTCSIQMDEPPLLTCSITKLKDVDCYGGNDGQANVSASGGIGPYTFDWGGEDPLALSAGSYTVTVTCANNCTSTCNVEIDEPPLLTCSTTVVSDVGCYGGTDGQASVNAIGGVAPYGFNWGGADPSALSAGTYTVTVTDSNSCTSTCNVEIDEPDLLICSVTKIKDADCFGGSDGQASVSASGGTTPYSFDWGGFDPGSLGAGTYTVTVTDANYCTSTCYVDIYEPPLLTCSITKIKDVDCYGGTDGQASVSATGGVEPYSFDWGSVDPIALSAGSYTVTVTDANYCTSTCYVDIYEPPLLTCSITKIKDVDCYGGTDGQASVSATGGVEPYSFDWGGVDPIALSAGSYTVTVTDANYCTSTCYVDIYEPPLLTCSITKIKDVDCYGGTDGQASVSATGGVEPYSFDWGGADPLALSAGSYTVTVTDANYCTSTCYVDIYESPLLTCTITKIKDVDCYGGNDGQASVSATGGVSPYSFDWGGADPLALSAGTYTVTVTDANYCTSTCFVDIYEPPLLACTITKIKDADCFGGSDGQASVSATGGVEPYSFDWGGANPLALSAGSYTVTVTDANYCTSTCYVQIEDASLLTCTITKIKDVDCYGGRDGQASVIASGGTAPYSFDWGGADPLALSVGSYTVSVTDANYCTSICYVDIYEPPLLTCSTTVVSDVSCFGGTDGQASVVASGGVEPYSFDWGSADPLALSAGTYTVTVTDANYCTSTCYVDIYEPPLLACTITKLKDADCYGGTDGQASVSATGGVSPYSFDWGGADPLALSAGSYTVTVTDANYCTSTCYVDIYEPPLLTCTITKIKDVDCYGDYDGQASVSATGGVTPYSFDWGGFDPNSLGAGTYTVTVTDANYCSSTCSIDIYEPLLLSCEIVKIKDVDCFGGNDGQASVSAIGGVAPYSFDWGGADPLALSAGTYTVTVTDANYCSSTCTVDIYEPPVLACNLVDIVHVECYGDQTGSVELYATGGTPPYSFDWGGADPNMLFAGTYEVIITDALGCEVSCRIIVDEPPALSCSGESNSESCYRNDGDITIYASGGVAPYEYSIDNGETYQSSNQFTALQAGTYLITVRDANNCITQCEVVVDIYCYDLAITKSVLDSEPFIIGSTVRYNLRIENQGLEPAYNAEFLDEPEAGLIYVGSNADSNPNISEPSAMLFRVSELLPGEVDEIEVEFRIDELFEGNFLTNQVQIVLDDGDDFDSDPDTGYDEDEDGDGNGDDDDEDGVTIPVTNRINIGDYVWFDRNGDGIQDPDEPGIPSIEVRLYNKRDFLVKKTFTNNDGLYLFENIVPGEYYVRFIYPDSYLTSPKNIGADDLDSDIDNSNGKGTTQLYTINSDNYTIDAGLLDCAVVSGTVWFDYNQNDVMDAFENGINNITVELYRYEDGEWVLWTTELTGLKPGTASDDGYYELCVDPGRYYIRFVNPPETLVPVLPFAGNPDVSSTITHSFGYGTTSDMDLLAGEFMINMNAGYYPMGTIGDLVWLDKNDNGLRESNEPGVANVTVRAVNSVGQVVSETISDEDGYYTLDYLEKDQYYIEVVTPLGMGITQANVGNDDSMDSDIDGSNGVGTSDRMMVLPGIHVPHVDIGILESVLPVEWLDFYGRRAGSKNHLNWEVATEINVSHYEVERSEEDEFDFVKIAEVDYKEPRTDVNYYDHEDYDIESGKVYYYRIKQIDLDGMFDYSKIISLQSDDFTFEEVQIGMYPNPAYDRVMLTFDHYTTIPSGEIMFMTTDGKLVRKIELLNESVSPDRPLSFDISDLPEGVYTWLLVIDDFSVVDRLVILD